MHPSVRNVPLEDKSIKVVDNLKDFVDEGFSSETNVILFRRRLSANFNAAAGDLCEIFALRQEDYKGIKQLSEAELEAAYLQASGETRKALGIIIDDIRSQKEIWDEVSLRLITPSGGDKTYHTDGADNGLGRVLCSYNGPATEGLVPEETTIDKQGFYIAAPDAKPFAFRVGDLWRCAGSRGVKNANVPPFVHRAPGSKNPRLLLVGDVRRAGF